MKRFIVENGVKSSDLESLPSKVQRSSVTNCHILTEDKDFRIKTFFISTFLQSQCPLVYSCKGVICKNIFCRRNEKTEMRIISRQFWEWSSARWLHDRQHENRSTNAQNSLKHRLQFQPRIVRNYIWLKQTSACPGLWQLKKFYQHWAEILHGI